MIQKAFLDTNVILDYLENRDKEVRDIIAQLLLLHKKGRIVLTTSVFNIAELIDKESEIRFIGLCLNEKMSPDEVMKKRNDRKFYKEILNNNGIRIKREIEAFLKKGIQILYILGEKEEYDEIFDLICKRALRSHDALIVTTAIQNNITYFLSNDSDLCNSIKDLLNTYNLRDKNELKSFKSDVLEAI